MTPAKKNVKKVVLAYSGGLDTSVIVPWLVENYGCEVVCFCANLGQEEELSGLEEKALASGASKIYIKICARSSSPTTSTRQCWPARSTSGSTCWAPASRGP